MQAKVPLLTESTARFFFIIATGVFDLILVDSGEYFSSCLRVKTSELDDATSGWQECFEEKQTITADLDVGKKEEKEIHCVKIV